MGEAPDSTTARKREQMTVHVGRFEDWGLRLDVNPLRIDWRAGCNPEDGGDGNTQFATVGRLPKALAAFCQLMKQWFQLDDCPDGKRLALGTVLRQPVDDRAAGYALCGRYLEGTVRLDCQRSSDFVYQINRPRPCKSGIDGLTVNRLTQWSVGKLVTAGVEVSPDRPPAHVVTSEAYAARLVLDVNTSGDFEGVLPTTRVPAILDELCACSMEIAEKGDIP